MADSLKIGLIGLDTSHVVAFSRLLNEPQNEHHISGGKIVAAFPGGSPDMPVSISRVEGFTNQLRDEFGIEIVDSPRAVAERVDLVFVTAADPRVHPDHLRQILPCRRPTFIDKPFAVSGEDATEMFRMANDAGVPLMSCSSLRYDDGLVAAMKARSTSVGGCDAFGPMSIEKPLPSLFWYGVHTVEVVVSIMGAGCRRLRAINGPAHEVITAEWNDGRVASMRLVREGHSRFGVCVHDDEGSQFIDLSANARPWYAPMLEAIVRTLPKGQSDIDPAQTLDVIRILEAGNQSRETGEQVCV